MPFPHGGGQPPFPGAPAGFAGEPAGGVPGSLPARPGFNAPPGMPGMMPANGQSATALAVDDLIASVTGTAAPPKLEALEKKGKKEKDKNSRMVYSDNEISPEERLAQVPRYSITAA